MPLEDTINFFKIAYDDLNSEIYPLRMQATSDPNKAHIKILFAENGDDRLPIPFREDHLAYAYYPYTDRVWEVYINDKYDRSSTRRFSLIRTIKHETLHGMGIPHNPHEEECLMSPWHRKSRTKLSPRMQKYFDILYEEEYKKALPQSLRKEKYDNITDKKRQEKAQKILESMIV